MSEQARSGSSMVPLDNPSLQSNDLQLTSGTNVTRSRDPGGGGAVSRLPASWSGKRKGRPESPERPMSTVQRYY